MQNAIVRTFTKLEGDTVTPTKLDVPATKTDLRAIRDEIVLLPGRRDLPTERMVLVGLGLRGELDLDAARQTAVSTVAMALRLQPKEVLFAMPCGGDEREFSEALLAGIVLGLGGELPGAGSQAQGTETQASEADAPQGEVVRAITGPWPAYDFVQLKFGR